MSLKFNLNPFAWVAGTLFFIVLYFCYVTIFPMVTDLRPYTTDFAWTSNLFENTVSTWDIGVQLLGALWVAYIVLSSIKWEREEYHDIF